MFGVKEFSLDSQLSFFCLATFTVNVSKYHVPRKIDLHKVGFKDL